MHTMQHIIGEAMTADDVRRSLSAFEAQADMRTVDFVERYESGEHFDHIEDSDEWYLTYKTLLALEAVFEPRLEIPDWVDLNEEAPKGAFFFLPRPSTVCC